MAEEKKNILLVDDSAPIHVLLNALLGTQYNVINYSSVHEALAGLKAHPQKIDLLITDYNMPGPDGQETESSRGIALIKTLRDEGYTFPAILHTGNNDEEITRLTAELKDIKGDNSILRKPASPPALIGAVEAKLSAKAASVDSPAPSKPVIILAEDEPISRKVLARLLTEKYDVQTAACADDAYGIYNKLIAEGRKVDLVITDHDMPAAEDAKLENGIDLIHALRSNFKAPYKGGALLYSGNDTPEVMANLKQISYSYRDSINHFHLKEHGPDLLPVVDAMIAEQQQKSSHRRAG